MHAVIFASCLLALAAAEPGYLGGAHLAYNALPVAAAVSSQYHAQDELGQYSYGYSGDTSAKHETRTLDGITQGGYSYLDANGLVQSASYVSDPVNGFRVAATNLPVGPSAPAPAVVAPYAAVHAAPYAAVHAAPYAALAGAPLPVADTPEVYAAKIAHFQAHAEAKGHLLGRKKRSVGYGHGIYGAPAAVVAGPSRSFAYSTVAAAPLAAPAVSTYAAAVPAYAAAVPARSFGYSTVSAHAAPAVVAAGPAAISTYAAGVPAATVVAAPARSFGYSTVSAHAAPAVATYAAAAPAAVVAGPARSFGYSTVSAHAAPAVATYTAAAPAGPSRSFAYSTVAAAPLAAPAVATYAAAAPAVLAAPARSFGYSTVAAHAVPTVATYAAAAPLAAHGIAAGSSQYRAQDELGQYSYGYADGNSVKHESRAFDGTTHGAYSYVDGHGLVQSVKYHADALGFRAVGTNFPVAH
ncbi:angiomotin-like [Bacillus rossius redtenbacheri]|uniref:angiomotin-like n=1 Tax=Bacillus rossius redtenbacheri TaxID=93214 RepID=UPI002FDEB16E